MFEHVADPFTFISVNGFVLSLDHANEWVDRDTLKSIGKTLEMINGCPVCWKMPYEDGALDWVSICGVSQRQEKTDQDLSLRAISKRILSEKRKNPSLTRDGVKELVAPTVSFRHFKTAWALASQEDASISKPDRKS